MFDLQDVTLKYTEANSSTLQHINDAANDIHTPVVAPQVPNAETVSAVTPELGNTATSFVSELVASGTETSVSAEKLSASLSKQLQNSGLERAACNSSEPIPGEEGNHVGKMVNRGTSVQYSGGESACQTGLVSVTEKADISGQVEGGTEKEECLRESCLEKVSTPQDISHVQFPRLQGSDLMQRVNNPLTSFRVGDHSHPRHQYLMMMMRMKMMTGSAEDNKYLFCI